MRSLPSSSDPSLSLSSRWHSVPLPAADTQKHPVAAATEQRSCWRISWGRLHTPSVLDALPLTPIPIFALLETGNGSCGFVCVAPTHARRSVKGDAAQSNIWSSICHSYTNTHTIQMLCLQTTPALFCASWTWVINTCFGNAWHEAQVYQNLMCPRGSLYNISHTSQSTPQLSLSNPVCAMKATALAINRDAGAGGCTHTCKHWVTNETNNRKRSGKCMLKVPAI